MDEKKLATPLLYGGLGVYAVFLIFSMFSLWSNAVIFSWITFKYLLLIALGALVVLLQGPLRRSYAVGLAALLGLLMYADQLTYHIEQVKILATTDLVAYAEKIKSWEKDLEGGSYAEEIERLRALRAGINADPTRLHKDQDKVQNDRRTAIDKEIEALQKKIDDNKQYVSDLEDFAAYRYDAAKVREKLDTREKNLFWAKGFDPLILIGAFLMLVGSLVDAQGGSSGGAAAPKPAQASAPKPAAPSPAAAAAASVPVPGPKGPPTLSGYIPPTPAPVHPHTHGHDHNHPHPHAPEAPTA